MLGMHSDNKALPLVALEFLRHVEVQEYLPLLRDPLKLSENLSKKFKAQERHAIMHYLEILPKIREKFGLDLICDRLAYEQATAKDISEYKAKLWPSGAKIMDLCCGMGGDSFWLPAEIAASGVDIAPERVLMFNENMERLSLSHRAILRNALEVEGGDFFCIDPARRGGLNPSFEEITELSKKFCGGMFKLPPAFPVDGGNVLYLGNENDCRECLMFSGALKNSLVRATNLRDEWQCEIDELQSVKLAIKKPGYFILEPCPVLVRSHLFLSEAKKLGFWQIDQTLAYVSCENLPPKHNGFNAYKIIDQSSLSTNNVKAMLRKHDAGKITLKKRGVEVVPEAEIRRLAPKGEREYILFYTRVLGEKRAILANSLISCALTNPLRQANLPYRF